MMNRYIMFFIVVLLNVSCNGQQYHSKKDTKDIAKLVEAPTVSWNVNKEFDENGNLIKYDSIYSWSSSNKFNNISAAKRDSLLQILSSRFFTNFSVFENEGFQDIFVDDSLFSNRFYNNDFFESDFGGDPLDIDKIRQEMLAKHKEYLEIYQKEFQKNEDEN